MTASHPSMTLRRPLAVTAFVISLVVAGCSTSSDPSGAHPRPSTTRSVRASTARRGAAEEHGCGDQLSTTGREQCFSNKVQTTDRKIAEALARLSRASGAPGDVARSQVLWTRYETSECSLEARAFTGGSEARVVAAACRARLGQARSSDLDAALQQNDH